MKILSRITICLILVLAAFEAQAVPGTLSFAQKVEVNGKRVTLLDLVDEKSEISPEVRQVLAGQTVMASPHLGRQARITGHRLRAFLRQAKLPKDLTVLLPQAVEVKRASSILTSEEIKSLFLEALRKRLGSRALEADIHGVTVGRQVTLPAGEVKTEVRFLSTRIMGRVPANIEVFVDGHKYTQIGASATVDMYGPVVVANRSLRRRHFIDADDVKLARINLADVRGDYATSLDEVEGLRTRKHMRRGDPVLMNHLERAPIIHRGAVVTMICEGPGLKITAKGKAEQSGYKGGRIRLLNLASKRQVYGKVLDAGTVLVEF